MIQVPSLVLILNWYIKFNIHLQILIQSLYL